MTENTLSAHITGKVQGVWYRGWTQATAMGLGLRGWVRNEPDGSVRAVLHGPREAVEKMIALMWEGPEAARVSEVETGETREREVPEGFEVRY